MPSSLPSGTSQPVIGSWPHFHVMSSLPMHWLTSTALHRFLGRPSLTSFSCCTGVASSLSYESRFAMQRSPPVVSWHLCRAVCVLCRKALARINVFKACELDRPGIEALVEGMSDAEAKLAAFDTACASNLCAVARLGVRSHERVPGLHIDFSCIQKQ